MGETISGRDPNSGLDFSMALGQQTGAPVNTTAQDMDAAKAVFGAIAAAAALGRLGPNMVTVPVGIVAGLNVASNYDNITQGATDLLSQFGAGPAFAAINGDAFAIGQGMMPGMTGAHNSSGDPQSDFGDPASAATAGVAGVASSASSSSASGTDMASSSADAAQSGNTGAPDASSASDAAQGSDAAGGSDSSGGGNAG